MALVTIIITDEAEGVTSVTSCSEPPWPEHKEGLTVAQYLAFLAIRSIHNYNNQITLHGGSDE